VFKIESESLEKGLKARKATSTDSNIFQDMDGISHIVSELSKSLLNLHQDSDKEFDVCI
jgi:hypothetical protein